MVLAVEDYDDVRDFAVAALESLGYRALNVRDGQSALDVLQREPEISGLLSNIGLAGRMDGIELAREARALKPGLKVLFMTGYGEDAFRAHGGKPPDSELLRKPYRVRDLKKKSPDSTASFFTREIERFVNIGKRPLCSGLIFGDELVGFVEIELAVKA